ncbi:ScbA/BarX family gamma-butyrolactone biosynthesis protein [Rhodococcus rhodnii]|uniref:A-factor biosynthesis protein n=2 Tax=Rhodococcus rhodnii TaxID=38312 RepID=R7WHW6_9NOCA|nr:ScbA/BarX family gamma-butyrolactone biosynthesis protein [Rhodococcus rhodnii]EOM74738.1 A-factor biosynthesis protein [Rhodococcus rhodnii LMG 5362]
MVVETVDSSTPVGRAPEWLSWERTVERSLVHRAAVAEVLLTDSGPTDDTDTHWVAAQLPRLHGFYRPVAGVHDPMLLVEAFRQSASMLGHRVHDVPSGHAFVISALRFTCEAAALRMRDVPARLAMRATFSDVAQRGGTVAGFALAADLFLDDRPAGSAGGYCAVMNPEAYSRMRGGRTSTPRIAIRIDPAPAADVGVARPADVVVGPRRGDEWPIRVDITHPVLFDHPSDHLPGMVTLEAIRQACRMHEGRPHALIQSFDISFHRFVELDAAAFVSVRPTGEPGVLRARVEQDGAVCASGRVQLD